MGGLEVGSEPQRAGGLAEGAAGQGRSAVALKEQPGQVGGGGDLVAVSQVIAPGLEVGVEVEAPAGGGTTSPALVHTAATAAATWACRARLAATRLVMGGGSVKARAAACWTGAQGADQISLPAPSSALRSRRPSGPAGIRAAPIRHPPRARFLPRPVVITVWSGAAWAGLSTGAAGSWIRSR